MVDRIAEAATAVAVVIETGAVLVFFAGLATILLSAFGIVPGPY